MKSTGRYVDATFGRGGHARAVLARLGPDGRLLALDRDPEAARSARRLAAEDGRVRAVEDRFSALARPVAEAGWAGQVDGLLLDLGVSSPQLDDPERGFSFLHDGPLDMRMDPSRGSSAADWLAEASEADLAEVLREYGEERYARRIARAIVAERAREPIATTGRLAAIIARAVPGREPNKHPATRSFLAIRIYVNQELEEVHHALPPAVLALRPGGRLAVISFHSLEDRLVKRFLRGESQGPVARLRLIGRAQRPGDEELRANPRARSAVLRVAERVQ